MPCSCRDCSLIQAFLQDGSRRQSEHYLSNPRRKHICQRRPASSCSSSETDIHGPTLEDYNKAWFTKREDERYCNLCYAYATEGHFASEKHIKHAQDPACYGRGEKSKREKCEAHTICSRCEIPICSECWHLSSKKMKIPKALCNDNFIGYAHKFVVKPFCSLYYT